jgi:hypothetical protein
MVHVFSPQFKEEMAVQQKIELHKNPLIFMFEDANIIQIQS